MAHQPATPSTWGGRSSGSSLVSLLGSSPPVCHFRSRSADVRWRHHNAMGTGTPLLPEDPYTPTSMALGAVRHDDRGAGERHAEYGGCRPRPWHTSMVG